MRPDQLVLVTGTGTEVGKTWVTAAVAVRLRAAGVVVAARKPAQSFSPGDAATDAEELGAATGERPETVCPSHRWYPVALAPPMAADELGRPRIGLDDLVAELSWPPGVAVGFVEAVGGLCSPIAHDGDGLALAHRLRPDLVMLVANPALGVVSHVRLALRALEGFDTLVVLNRYDDGDDTHGRGRDWLVSVDGLRVATTIDAVLANLRR